MSTRPLLVLVAAAMAAVAAFPVVGASASPPALRADQIGWWSQAQPATSGLGLPTRVTAPAPPTTPSGSAPVSAVAGQSSSVVAIGFAGAGTGDATAETVTVTVPLAAGATDTNGASATIAACPISAPWGPADNGPMSEAPPADCDHSSPGQRQPEGAWRFELVPADLVHGVLLVEQVDPPTTFQVPFTRDTSAVGVEVAGITTGAAPSSPPPPGPAAAPSYRAAPSSVSPGPAVVPAGLPDGLSSAAPPPRTPAAMPALLGSAGSSRHLPSLPSTSIILGLVAVVSYALAGLSVGRRLLNQEVAP